MNYYDFVTLKNDITANSGRMYEQCSISLMDTIADPNITFDKDGICNYYHFYKKAAEKCVFTKNNSEKIINNLVSEIKNKGRSKEFDCITGVSGGADSTFLIYKLKELGLRALIVHFDNGWNSSLAVKNIENIISYTGFPLHTLVVDWEEFRDIQRSYFRASVVDIEAPTDHAIRGTLGRLALEHGIKYIFSGYNIVTEAVLPRSWVFNKMDHVNLKAIHDKYGTVPLKTFPLYNYSHKDREHIMKIKTIPFLNYLQYNKEESKKIISDKILWSDYGGKHYESIFTKFYQAYVLPRKFNIDKRKAHLSNLIFSGQMTKAEALNEISKPLYDEYELKNDYEFVIKKLGFTAEEFENIMDQKRAEHWAFPVEHSLWQRYWYLKPLRLLKKNNRQI